MSCFKSHIIGESHKLFARYLNPNITQDTLYLYVTQSKGTIIRHQQNIEVQTLTLQLGGWSGNFLGYASFRHDVAEISPKNEISYLIPCTNDIDQ